MISVCMIVKCDDRLALAHFENALKSVEELAGEIVVLITGGLPEAVEVAERYGAKNFNYDWADNFSEARNESLKHTSGEWTLILDHDDEVRFLEPRETFKRFLADLPETVGCVYLECMSTRAGQNEASFNQPRLFRGLVEYKHRIHNQPKWTGEAVFYNGARILHVGYDLPADQMEAKRLRTIRLCELDLADGRQEALFFLAQAELSRGNFDEAAGYITRYIEACQDTEGFYESAYHTAYYAAKSQGDMKSAAKWLSVGVNALPNDPDLAWDMQEFGTLTGNAETTADGCRRYLNAYRATAADLRQTGNRFRCNFTQGHAAISAFRLATISLGEGMSAWGDLISNWNALDAGTRRAIQNVAEKQLPAMGLDALLEKLKPSIGDSFIVDYKMPDFYGLETR